MTITNSKTRLMFAAFFTPIARGWGLPLKWEGPPGNGKTTQHKSFAQTMQAPIKVCSPGEEGEGAFGVIPVPCQSGDRMVIRYPAPDWIDTLIDANGDAYGLVLADELTTAPPAIQPALLGLTLEGRIGGAKLGPRVRVFAATNSVSDAANGYDLNPAQANRLIHLNWEVNAADVANFFSNMVAYAHGIPTATIDPVAEETRVMALWPSALAASANKVAAFLRAFPDLAHRMPKEGDPSRSGAWPSPRSWEMAIRCQASGTVHNLTAEEVDTLGAGCVGENAWQTYCDYIAAQDLPNAADVLDGVTQWQPDAKRLDITSAVINAAVAVVIPKDASKREARIGALWALLGKVGSAGARDLTHGPAQAMIKAGFLGHPAALQVMADMRASGFVEALK